MTVQINANQFSLKYLPDEDRLLFSVAMSSEHELGILLTRRLTRLFLDGLLKHAPETQIAPQAAATEAEPGGKGQPGSAAGKPDAARENAARENKEEAKPKALAFPPKLVREIKIAPKEGGDIALVFNNGEQNLVLDVMASRILVVAEIFLDLAGKAGWDFGDLASRPGKPAVAESEIRGKVLH